MKFEKIGDTIDRGISILVYSNPGVGKTTCAATLPPGETLIINTEAGVGPLLGTEHIVFNVNGENVLDLEKMYTHLKTEKHPFKNVVLDNVSQLEQWLLLHYTQHRGKEFPELREYGDCAVKMRQWMIQWRDLTCDNINVVMNAWEMLLDVKQDAGLVKTLAFPKMGKKLAPDLCGLVDIVAHIECHEKSGKRWLRIGPSDEYITKTQFKGLDSGESANLPELFDKVMSYDYGDGSMRVRSAIEKVVNNEEEE